MGSSTARSTFPMRPIRSTSETISTFVESPSSCIIISIRAFTAPPSLESFPLTSTEPVRDSSSRSVIAILQPKRALIGPILAVTLASYQNRPPELHPTLRGCMRTSREHPSGRAKPCQLVRPLERNAPVSLIPPLCSNKHRFDNLGITSAAAQDPRDRLRPIARGLRMDPAPFHHAVNAVRLDYEMPGAALPKAVRAGRTDSSRRTTSWRRTIQKTNGNQMNIPAHRQQSCQRRLSRNDLRSCPSLPSPVKSRNGGEAARGKRRFPTTAVSR